MLWLLVSFELEVFAGFGKKQKEICENERVSAIVQRRCIRANVDLEVGAKIRRSDLCVLRPATEGSIRPNEIDLVVGRTLKVNLVAGKQLSWSDIE